jgi:hypothetical protein
MCEVMTGYATASGAGTLPCYDIICRTWSPEHLVASVRLTRSECQANARLIAAAPELLEACIYLVQGIEACGLTGVYLDQARAAIAKAEEVKP